MLIHCRDGIVWHKSDEKGPNTQDDCYSWMTSSLTSVNTSEQKGVPCTNKMAMLCVFSA